MDVFARGRRQCAVTWSVGQLILAVAIASCSGSDRNNAATCGAAYDLGCVGDGRPDSETTPGSLPKTSCEKDAYTYFKVHVMSVSSPRDDIARCQLVIADASGERVAEYILASGTTTSGTAYGCSLGQTRADVGWFSYSSCCAAEEVLTFNVVATSSNDEVVQEGSASGTCAAYPPEVAVEVPIARP